MGKYLLPVWPFLIAICYLPARAEDKPPKKLPDLPWHLVDVYLGLEEQQEFTTLSVDLQFLDDIPNSGNSLFIVPLCGHVGEEQFYAGVINRDMMAKNEKEFYKLSGPGYVVTKFGEARAAAVRPARGAHKLISDHEGPHSSLRQQQQLSLAAGRYTFLMSKLPKPSQVGTVDISFSVTRHGRNSKTTDIGVVTFNGSKATISPQLVSFFEVAQSWEAAKDQFHAADEHPFGDTISECRIVVGNWQLNGRDLTPNSARCVYDAKLPQKAKVMGYNSIDNGLVPKVDNELRKASTLVIFTGDKPYPRSEKEAQLKDRSGRAYNVFLDDAYKEKFIPMPPPKPLDESVLPIPRAKR